MNKLSKYVAGVAGLALIAGTATALADEDSNDQTTSSHKTIAGEPQPENQPGNNTTPNISRSEAEQAAQARVPGGTIEGSSLERQNNGQQVWLFDVAAPGSQGCEEVAVDADNGNVISVEQETAGSPASKGGQNYANQPYNEQQNRWTTRGNGTSQRMLNRRYFDTKRLIGEEVSDLQGESLGNIKDTIFNTQGHVFVVVNLGNNQNTLVPVQALRITGAPENPQVTLNTTRQNLERGPLVQNNQWLQALRNPNFAQRIYSEYNLQLQPNEELGVLIVTPIPQGGAGNLGGSTSGQGAGQRNSQGTGK